MSPQFVDFNADGNLDIVAGTFDGSPHVAFGTGPGPATGWKQPEQILDRAGARIVLNDFWNFDAKKWDATTRCDPPGHDLEKGQCTSAWAMDWDGDGDLDLLLGDYKNGYLYRRMNEGTSSKPQFATVNVPVLAGGKPLHLEGKMGTMRLVDWNRDGLMDLVCSSMGDAYSEDGEGGGVYLFLNRGKKDAPEFAEPVTLVAAGKKEAIDGPTRPDSGLYVDVADDDGDGDLDLIVGGYSHWKPKARQLTPEEKERVKVLQADLKKLDQRLTALSQAMMEAAKGIDDPEAANKKRTEVLKEQAAERSELAKKRAAISTELDPLVPGPKRVSFCWRYENLGNQTQIR